MRYKSRKALLIGDFAEDIPRFHSLVSFRNQRIIPMQTFSRCDRYYPSCVMPDL
jgi:hypothetical protein